MVVREIMSRRSCGLEDGDIRRIKEGEVHLKCE
jgi:hypothetical protein